MLLVSERLPFGLSLIPIPCGGRRVPNFSLLTARGNFGCFHADTRGDEGCACGPFYFVRDDFQSASVVAPKGLPACRECNFPQEKSVCADLAVRGG